MCKIQSGFFVGHCFCQAALHDSAIVDNLTIAEQVAYTEAPRLNLRVKVITLDGEKVLKNGNITVDTSVSS